MPRQANRVQYLNALEWHRCSRKESKTCFLKRRVTKRFNLTVLIYHEIWTENQTFFFSRFSEKKLINKSSIRKHVIEPRLVKHLKKEILSFLLSYDYILSDVRYCLVILVHLTWTQCSLIIYCRVAYMHEHVIIITISMLSISVMVYMLLLLLFHFHLKWIQFCWKTAIYVSSTNFLGIVTVVFEDVKKKKYPVEVLQN